MYSFIISTIICHLESLNKNQGNASEFENGVALIGNAGFDVTEITSNIKAIMRNWKKKGLDGDVITRETEKRLCGH